MYRAYRETGIKIVTSVTEAIFSRRTPTYQKTFYALAIYGMLNNVKQNGSGNDGGNAERMNGFVGVRMPAPILVKFSGFAMADGRTPSGLMRKLATDYVTERELQAVPQTPTVQAQPAPQSSTPSPWDI